jgi:BASS family bile acid:Na+ symporter
MTPTAALSDLFLPVTMWLERNQLTTPYTRFGQFARVKVVDPPGECRDDEDILLELAHRLGLHEAFPWNTVEEYLDWRLAGTGKTFHELKKEGQYLHPQHYQKYETLWAFVLCPALAYLLGVVLPLTEPYAMGLMLLGLAPCAPLLPMMADKARGDVNYAASFMLLASAGTVIYMPLAVPLLVKGLTVSAWAVAKPMLLLVMIPLLVGIAIQMRRASTAAFLQPYVKNVTSVDTLLMLLLVVVIYAKGFVGAIGTWAILAQVLFFTLTIVGSYALAFGVPPRRKSVLTLGLSTRNCGAALAPLLVASDVEQNAIVMVSLGIPMMFIAALIAARVFAARAGQPAMLAAGADQPVSQ